MAGKHTIPCIVCDRPAKKLPTIGGYTRFRCPSGHSFKIATAKQAAKNWNRSADRRTEAR